MISVAIDGPSGAGKSTLARRLAKEFSYVYIDTGALYRTIGLFLLRHGADPKDETQAKAHLPQINIDLRHIDGEQRMFLNGEDVSDDIRTEAVSMAASNVSAHPCVRAFLLDTQRNLAKSTNVIMDGRDIGTVVLPDATVKIFLFATPEDRAQRRTEQLHEKGDMVAYEDVLADVKQRDHNDTTREIAPLKPAEDSIMIETTGWEFDQSFAYLCDVIRSHITNE